MIIYGNNFLGYLSHVKPNTIEIGGRRGLYSDRGRFYN